MTTEDTAPNSQAPAPPAPPMAARAAQQPSSPGRMPTPTAPMQLSPKMRALLGGSPFRDASAQATFEELQGVLAAEFGAASSLQMSLIERVTLLIMEIRAISHTVQTAIVRRQVAAAREIIDADFSDFFPPPAGATRYSGSGVETAYGQYMETKGDKVFSKRQAEVMAEALEILADEGLGEEELMRRAYILALPEIEKLERLIASKQAEQEALVEQLLRLKDRMDRKQAISIEAAH
jgi:hypothetical protein